MRPMKEREDAIRLYTEEHRGYKTIAKEMGLPLNTIKSWIRRYRNENSLSLSGRPGRPPKTSPEEKIEKDYEKRIKQLEMEVALLRDFLSVEERRSIKK